MLSKELVEEKIKALSNEELIKILNLNISFNREAVTAALTEAKKRDLKSNKITELQILLSAKTVNTIVEKDVSDKRLYQWNWGAFLFNGFWAYPNGFKKLAFLSFVPGINLITMFYLGTKGTIIGWKQSTNYTLEEYLTLQDYWKIAAFKLLLISVIYRIVLR